MFFFRKSSSGKGGDMSKICSPQSQSSLLAVLLSPRPTKSGSSSIFSPKSTSSNTSSVFNFNQSSIYVNAIKNLDDIIRHLYINPKRNLDYAQVMTNLSRFKCSKCHVKKAEFNYVDCKAPLFCFLHQDDDMVNTRYEQEKYLKTVIDDFLHSKITNKHQSPRIIIIEPIEISTYDGMEKYTTMFQELLDYVFRQDVMYDLKEI